MAEATSHGTDTVTEDQPVSNALDDILSSGISDGEESSSEETDTATAEGEDSPQETEQDEGVEAEESTEEEGSEAEDSEEEPDEEEALLPSEEETDFSDAAYERYAKHFSKQFGNEIDPTDPLQRKMLRELIQRGQALARQKAEAEAEPEEEAGEEPATKEPAATAQPPATVEQYLERLSQYTAPRINPKVAEHFGKRFTNALWPDKNVSLTAKQSSDLLQTFMDMGLMLFTEEMIPATQARMHEFVEQAYPYIGRVQQTAITEQALENLESTTGKDGQPLYPDLETLADSGVIRKVFQDNPWISKGNYVDAKGKRLDPLQQTQRQLEIAVKIARGEHINPNIVRKAVETGKKSAQKSARTIASSRLSAGRTKGAISATKSSGSVIDQLKGVGGDDFSSAIARDRAAQNR